MRFVLALLIALAAMPALAPPPAEAGSRLYDRPCMKLLKYRGVPLDRRQDRCHITRDVLRAPRRGPTPVSVSPAQNDAPDVPFKWDTGDALVSFRTILQTHKHWDLSGSNYVWVVDDVTCGLSYAVGITLKIESCVSKPMPGGHYAGAIYTTTFKVPILDIPITFGYHSFVVLIDQTPTQPGYWTFALGQGAF